MIAEGILATALPVIEVRSEEDALNRIVALAGEREVGRLVVGMPLSLNGSTGPQAGRVASFVEALRRLTELPVVTWDERLSSVSAERVLAEAGMKRRKRKKRIDSVAAAFILQGYLDRERSGTPPPD